MIWPLLLAAQEALPDTPALALVRQIKIDGNYPLFRQEVIMAMSIRVGDPFKPTSLAAEQKRLLDFLRNEGFIRPAVAIEAKTLRDKNIRLIVRVTCGPYYRLGKLNIRHHGAKNSRWYKARMQIWWNSLKPGPSGRFCPKILPGDLLHLTTLLREQGYPEAKISLSSEQLNPKNKRVALELLVDEGPNTRLTLVGNREISKFRLRAELDFTSPQGGDRLSQEKNVETLRQFYHESGFSQVRVRVEEKNIPGGAQTGGGATREIIYQIEEGPRSLVKNIHISGNKAISRRKIRQVMLLRPTGMFKGSGFCPETFQRDIEEIRFLYQDSGFLHMNFSRAEYTISPDKSQVEIWLDIEEGHRSLTGQMTLRGLPAGTVSTKILRGLQLKSGKPYRETLRQQDENKIAHFLADQGFLHVKVQSESRASREEREDIIFSIEPGPLVCCGEVRLQGNFHTDDQVLLRELPCRSGEPFSLRKMMQSEKELRDFNIFQSLHLRPVGLDAGRDKIDIEIDVNEKTPYYFETGLGYETDRGLRAFSLIGSHNLFGYNKQFETAGDINQDGFSLDTRLYDPRFLHLKLTGIWTGHFEKKREPGYLGQTMSPTFGVIKRWPHRIISGLAFSYERKDLIAVYSDESAGENAMQPRNVAVITPSLSLDSRDNYLSPKKGHSALLMTDFSFGLSGEQDDFIRYQLDIKTFVTPIRFFLPEDRINLNHWFTIALLFRAGFIEDYGQASDIPIDQRFYLGGTQDLRGYEEDSIGPVDETGQPLGGKLSLMASIEWRFPIKNQFEIPFFFDTGSVTNRVSEVKRATIASSFGTGLRYITPIGPVGFVYGIRLDQPLALKNGRFHFNIGYQF
jgi:outer membrane protein insertion porin family